MRDARLETRRPTLLADARPLRDADGSLPAIAAARSEGREPIPGPPPAPVCPDGTRRVVPRETGRSWSRSRCSPAAEIPVSSEPGQRPPPSAHPGRPTPRTPGIEAAAADPVIDLTSAPDARASQREVRSSHHARDGPKHDHTPTSQVPARRPQHPALRRARSSTVRVGASAVPRETKLASTRITGMSRGPPVGPGILRRDACAWYPPAVPRGTSPDPSRTTQPLEAPGPPARWLRGRRRRGGGR